MGNGLRRPLKVEGRVRVLSEAAAIGADDLEDKEALGFGERRAVEDAAQAIFALSLTFSL